MRSMHAFLTLLGEFIATHHARLRHFAKVACVILLCAAALEVVVFNFNHWRSLTWQPITANEQSNLQETADERLRISAIDNTIEFDYVGVPVHNIKLDFSGNQSAQNVPVKIWFTDDAHSTYFDDDEYTAGVPVTYVSTNNEESKYLNINASGSVYKLRIQVGIDDGETKVTYPLYLSKVVLNAPEPFSFRGERFLFAACIMALIYAFRPKSSLYRTQLREHPRRTKIAVIGVAAVRNAVRMLSLRFERPPAQGGSKQQEQQIIENLNVFATRHKLSQREREVLYLILLGKDNQNIASEMSLALSTVKVHVHNILKKTGDASRQELIQGFWKMS